MVLSAILGKKHVLVSFPKTIKLDIARCNNLIQVLNCHKSKLGKTEVGKIALLLPNQNREFFMYTIFKIVKTNN